MSMSYLPDPTTLAGLVSNVTKTMCGLSFAVADPSLRSDVDCWRMALLHVGGQHPWRVALFSDRAGCTALGAALCGAEPDMLDDGMIEDALRELLNMAAGQIKNLLSPLETLGLPKIISYVDLSPCSQAALRDGVLFCSRASVNPMLWISDPRVAGGASRGASAPLPDRRQRRALRGCFFRFGRRRRWRLHG